MELLAAFRPARLSDLSPARTALRARFPTLLSAPLTLDQIVFMENVPYDSSVRGAHVSKIDGATATFVAAQISTMATATGLPVWYLAACLARESRFDPGAYNENLTLFNRTPTFDGTDWGVAQFSGRWSHKRPGCDGLPDAAVKAKLLDPMWAITEFGRVMAGNIAWARGLLASPKGVSVSTAISQVASNLIYATAKYAALWLATMAYNSGTDGALKDLMGPHARINHPNSVMSTARELEQELSA